MENRNDIKRIEDLAIPSAKSFYTKPDLKLTQTPSIQLDAEYLRKHHIYTDVTDKTSAIAINAYKNLRTQVLRKLDNESINSLMVTGPTQGVGKTVTAINLAISIARHTRRTVMLVDLDLKAPSIVQYFGLEPQYGIVDVVTEDVPVEEVLISPGVQRLSLLPGTSVRQDSTELLLSHRMQQLIKEIKNRYRERIVIFDTPPALLCDDVSALVPLMESCLMVVKEGLTRKKELNQAMNNLGDLKIAGIISNQSNNPIFNNPYY